MEHEEAIDALWELYDGELAENRRAAALAHAERCAECRRTLESWRAVSRAFFSKPAAPGPFQTEAFVSRVMSRIAEQREPRAVSAFARLLSPRWLVPALAGLAAASLLAVPGLRAVPDPAETIILEQKGGRTFWSFVEDSAPPSRDDVLAFVQGER